jgi:hypothetical protein
METGNLIVDAQTAFSRQRRRRRTDRAKRWLLRQPRECSQLPSLDHQLGASATQRRPVGMQAVALNSIVGTAESSKARAFDHRFRPPPTSRHRWERLWVAARRGEPLPPVSVLQLCYDHFLVDGHHRVSVAHDLGMHAIDAEVTKLG